MFVHAGFFHLLGNMLFLYLFGCCVEDMVGRWRYLALYLLGGLLAELAYIAMTPEHFASEIPLGGASGAISACLGAYLLLRAGADIEFKYFAWFFFRAFGGDFSLAAWIPLSFWFIKDLVFAAISFHSGQGEGGVAFGAHVGGFLTGLGIIGIYKLFDNKEAKPSEQAKVRAAQKPAPQASFQMRTASEEPAIIYLSENGNQTGPFSLGQVQQMMAQGGVTGQTFYWQDGMAEWRSVSELGLA